MNINELTSSIYNSTPQALSATSFQNLSTYKAQTKEQKESEFESIFNLVLDNLNETNIDSEKINQFQELKTEIMKSIDSDDDYKTDDINEILLSNTLAKEYLESEKGRQVLVSMAENSIAGIITGNNK